MKHLTRCVVVGSCLSVFLYIPQAWSDPPGKETGKASKDFYTPVYVNIDSWNGLLDDSEDEEEPQKVARESLVVPKRKENAKNQKPKENKPKLLTSEDAVTSLPPKTEDSIVVEKSITELKDLGLGNLGNTCFANAVHKLLFAHPRVSEFTAEEVVLDETSDAVERKGVQRAFHELVTGLHQTRTKILSQSVESLSYSPYFRKELGKLFGSFEELLKVNNSDGDSYFSKEFSYSGLERKFYLMADQLDADEYLTRLMAILEYESFFGGFKEAALDTFESGMKRISHDGGSVQTSLHLPIVDDKIDSVAKAIIGYLAPEKMEGENQVFNETTSQKENATKQLVLLKNADIIPDQLIIRLRRFDFNPKTMRDGKLSKKVEISEEIEVEFFERDTVISEHPVSTKKKMRPLAVVVHHGWSPRAGHYIAYVYDQDQKAWYMHDDTSVSALKGSALVSAMDDMATNGYIVLYQVQ